MGVCNCSMFCCTLLCVRSSIAIILMGKRELVALLNLSSWCLVMVERLFLAVPQGCLRFVIVVFPDHTHLLFFIAVRCLKENVSLIYIALFESKKQNLPDLLLSIDLEKAFDILTWKFIIYYVSPNCLVVKASASGAGGQSLESQCRQQWVWF